MKTLILFSSLFVSQICWTKFSLAQNYIAQSTELNRKEILQNTQEKITGIQDKLGTQPDNINISQVNDTLIEINENLNIIESSIELSEFERQNINLETKKVELDFWQIAIGSLAIFFPLLGIIFQLREQNKHKYNEWKSKLRQKIIEEVLEHDCEKKQQDRAEKIWVMLSDFDEKDLVSFRAFFRKCNASIDIDPQTEIKEKISNKIEDLKNYEFNGTRVDNKNIIRALNDCFRFSGTETRALLYPVFKLTSKK